MPLQRAGRTGHQGALDISRARWHLGYAPRYDVREGLAAHIEASRRL